MADHLPDDDGQLPNSLENGEHEQQGAESTAPENTRTIPRIMSRFGILILTVCILFVASYAADTNHYVGISSSTRNNVNSAPSSSESFSYDSIRDRVLRYVTSTRNLASYPTVDVATYVRLPSERKSSVPWRSIPEKVGDRVFEVLPPKATAAVSNFREWIESEMNLLKPESTSPVLREKKKTSLRHWIPGFSRKIELSKPDATSPSSKDKTHPPNPSPVGDLDAYTTKVVDELKFLESIVSKDITSPSQLKLPHPFSVEELQAYAAKVNEDISILGDEALKALPAPHMAKTITESFSKADIDAYRVKVAEKIKHISEKLIETPVASLSSAASLAKSKIQKRFSDAVSTGSEAVATEGMLGFGGWVSSRLASSKPSRIFPVPGLRHESKESKTAEENDERRENKSAAPKHKTKVPDLSKDSKSSFVSRSSPTQSKGGFEKWWSGFRLAGPPTSSPTKVVPAKSQLKTAESSSAPFPLFDLIRSSRQKSSEEATSVTVPKSSTTQSKGAFESWWSEFRLQGPPLQRPPLQGPPPIMASSREPKEAISPPARETESARPSREKKKTVKSKHISPFERSTSPKVEDSTAYVEKPTPSKKKIPKEKHAEVIEKHTSTAIKTESAYETEEHLKGKAWRNRETSTSLPWYQKLGGSTNVPAELHKEASEPTSRTSENAVEDKHNEFRPERAGKQSGESGKESVRQATMGKASVTAMSFLELLEQGRRRLQHPDENDVLSERDTLTVETITVRPFMPSPKTVSDKSESKCKINSKSQSKSPVSNIYPVDEPVYPSSGESVSMTEREKSKITGHSRPSPIPTGRNMTRALVNSLLGALPDFLLLKPLIPERQTWTEWASSFFHLSGWEDANLTSLFTPNGTQLPMSRRNYWWWSSQGKFTRDDIPKNPADAARFFNSARYRHRSAKIRTAEAILDIQGTLYDMTDQLIAEGNQHFENQTRLRGAWGGLAHGEAVMNSSQTIKEMAGDVENRSLLRSYNGVVHKFARLASDVAEAANRIIVSQVVTEADVRHWRKVEGGFNKFMREVRKRPFFSGRELVFSEGFHWDILVGGRDKLESARFSLKKLTGAYHY